MNLQIISIGPLMSLYSFYFLFFFSILISCCTFFALAWGIRRQKEKKLNEMVDTFVFETEEAEKDIEEQIDQRLNDIIVGFKMQIPMMSVFLSKTKEAELKETAKNELVKLFPALKQRFLQKFTKNSKNSSLSLEEQLHLRVNQLLDSLWQQVKYPLLRIAIAVGAIFGLLEVTFFYLLF